MPCDKIHSEAYSRKAITAGRIQSTPYWGERMRILNSRSLASIRYSFGCGLPRTVGWAGEKAWKSCKEFRIAEFSATLFRSLENVLLLDPKRQLAGAKSYRLKHVQRI